MVGMGDIGWKNLYNLKKQYEEKYDEIIAIRPSGWSHSKTSNNSISVERRGKIIVVEAPYSEHSSFDELREFITFFQPKKVIPTVYSDEQQLNNIHYLLSPIYDHKPSNIKVSMPDNFFEKGKSRGKKQEEKKDPTMRTLFDFAYTSISKVKATISSVFGRRTKTKTVNSIKKENVKVEQHVDSSQTSCSQELSFTSQNTSQMSISTNSPSSQSTSQSSSIEIIEDEDQMVDIEKIDVQAQIKIMQDIERRKQLLNHKKETPSASKKRKRESKKQTPSKRKKKEKPVQKTTLFAFFAKKEVKHGT